MIDAAQRKWVTEVLITPEALDAKIKELASWVNTTYAESKSLVLVGLLKGSIPFLAQLIKDLHVPFVLDFMTVSTYEGKAESTRNFKIVMDLKQNIANCDVLIVEDIVDSGLTLSSVIKIMQVHKPKSLRVLTLLDKPAGRQTNFKVDRYGFVVPHVFLVGFGLDYKEKLRGLPFIGIFDLTRASEL